MVVLAPVIIGYAWVVGQGFGYLLFKTVGAGSEIQGLHKVSLVDTIFSQTVVSSMHGSS